MRFGIRSLVGLTLSSALLTSAVVTTSGTASAQSAVSGSGKGIAGGALLGGEVGFVVLSAAGAKQSWMYWVIPTALAIGGGVGGYFVEKGTTGSDAQVPMFMLAGGMALIIPTVVITLSANAYTPGSEDATPVDAAPADAGKPSLGVQVNGGAGGGTTTTAPPATPKHKPLKTSLYAPPITRPQGLVNFDELTTLKLSLPVIAVKPMYSKTEMAQFGQAQRFEVHAPIVSVAF